MWSDVDVLKLARRLIEDPARWVQGCVATDQYGSRVSPDDSGAVCFCATGAVIRVVRPNRHDRETTWRATRLLGMLDELSGCHSQDGQPRPLAQFNDTHTHAEVLELFDRAIAQLEAAHG